MEPIIEINGLTKDYEKGFWKKKKIRALEDLNLSVEAGQIFGFLGGNGAGKTTTIKLLMSLIFPTAGTARILGREIGDVAMHKSIGYCPESPYFYDYLKASELMNYFGQLFGLDKSKRTRRTEELLTRVGLEKKDWNKQLRKFSKGMLQRVGLAQCLINDPKIVFLDEPMSGLDPVGRRQVRELIAELRDEGKTVFMSSHILTDIEALCDNVAILRDGRLEETGNLGELLRAQGGDTGFEITVGGVNRAKLESELESLSATEFKLRPNGISLIVESEEEVSAVLAGVGKLGGKLIGVSQVKQSLEELFVKDTVA
ncbi:MAG: ABC transporter ATP-binding protein [Acidobacteriota bacterium]|nr:ABC transporter ATP-binding protein [Acidobacteriota bacterium]MDH3530235.1 ABC transporter ATP-binding protein [Acidobacteriota bacterium]